MEQGEKTITTQRTAQFNISPVISNLVKNTVKEGINPVASNWGCDFLQNSIHYGINHHQ